MPCNNSVVYNFSYSVALALIEQRILHQIENLKIKYNLDGVSTRTTTKYIRWKLNTVERIPNYDVHTSPYPLGATEKKATKYTQNEIKDKNKSETDRKQQDKTEI